MFSSITRSEPSRIVSRQSVPMFDIIVSVMAGGLARTRVRAVVSASVTRSLGSLSRAPGSLRFLIASKPYLLPLSFPLAAKAFTPRCSSTDSEYYSAAQRSSSAIWILISVSTFLERSVRSGLEKMARKRKRGGAGSLARTAKQPARHTNGGAKSEGERRMLAAHRRRLSNPARAREKERDRRGEEACAALRIWWRWNYIQGT